MCVCSGKRKAKKRRKIASELEKRKAKKIRMYSDIISFLHAALVPCSTPRETPCRALRVLI